MSEDSIISSPGEKAARVNLQFKPKSAQKPNIVEISKPEQLNKAHTSKLHGESPNLQDVKTETSVETISGLAKKLSHKKSKNPLPDSVHGVGNVDGAFEKLNGLQILGTAYRVGRRIGSGSFGQVRMARNIKTGEKLAVKLESNDAKHHQLAHEWEIYKVLNRTPTTGVARAYHYGSCGTYLALVEDLLGPSLEQIFKMYNRSFSLHTISLIAIQLIDRVESLHAHHILHRDIKPENFLICKPPKPDKTIYVVDFGLSKLYIDPISQKHIPFKDRCTVTGTPRYMSLNAHKGFEQSRRDDLEAIGHVLIYFLRGSLPWQGCRRSSPQERHKHILGLKKELSVEELCEGYPPQFVHYMHYVRNLDFHQKPNYNLLRHLFLSVLEMEGYDLESSFDWTDKLK